MYEESGRDMNSRRKTNINFPTVKEGGSHVFVKWMVLCIKSSCW